MGKNTLNKTQVKAIAKIIELNKKREALEQEIKSVKTSKSVRFYNASMPHVRLEDDPQSHPELKKYIIKTISTLLDMELEEVNEKIKKLLREDKNNGKN